MALRHSILILGFATSQLVCLAQNQTINRKPAASREISNAHKALLIPFEPRLYMSEIDRNIHLETKMSAKQIRHAFREGLNEQLEKAFKASRYNVLDLIEDTVKYRKETEAIYQFIVYEYLKVPDQTNYKAPQKEKQQKGIEKGQLVIETNGEQRFMNARLSNPKLVPSLQSKYKTDIFVFINQLDLKASGSKDPMNPAAANSFRKIIVHYTVYTADGIEINSGTVEEEFDPALNSPRRIIEKHFSRVAATIVDRVNKGLATAKK